MKYLIFIVFVCVGFHGFGQVHVELSISPEITSSNPIYFLYEKGKESLSDNGIHRFVLEESISPGVYRILYNIKKPQTDYLDVIINKQDSLVAIELVQTARGKLAVSVRHSTENKRYYNYLKDKSRDIEKLSYLKKYLDIASNQPSKEDEKLMNEVVNNYEATVRRLDVERETFIKQKDFHWSNLLVVSSLDFIPSIDGEVHLDLDAHYDSYWQRLPTLNEDLLQTPLARELIQSYFRYYLFHEKYGEDIAVLKSAVDKTLGSFEHNAALYKFAIEELQAGFKSLDHTELLQYVDVNYAANAAQCVLSGIDDPAFQQRLKKYESFKKGAAVPDIAFPDEGILSLKDIAEKYVVLIFHSSSCPHCLQQIPEVYKALSKKQQVKMVSILLDHRVEDYNRVKAAYPEMLHYSALNGWEGKVADAYFIQATPTYFLLDEHRNLIKEFKTASSVVNYLSQF